MNVLKSILPDHYNFDFGKPEIDEVIKRLQMWEELKKRYGFYLVGGLLDSYGNVKIEDFMNKVEQSHFPKPKIRKEIRVEVLAENENVIDELAKDIEDMNGRIFHKGKIRVVTTRWESE